MKQLILFILLLFGVLSTTFAQGINFEPFLIDKLLEKAKKENKNIFIAIMPCDCIQNTGLIDAFLKEKYEKNFISSRCIFNDKALNILKMKYFLPEGAAILYFNADGALLYRKIGLSKNAAFYIDAAEKALANIPNVAEMKALDKAYLAGNNSNYFLKAYAQMKISFGMKSDAFANVKSTNRIIEQYAAALSDEDLAVEENALFILEQGLPLNSAIYPRLKKVLGSVKVDSIINKTDANRILPIKQTIINNSWNEAKETHNTTLAYETAQFTKEHLTNDKHHYQSVSINMRVINYFKNLNDTLNILKESKNLAESLMKTPLDTLTAWNKDTRYYGMSNPAYTTAFYSMNYSLFLNNSAWNFYLFSKDTNELKAASEYAKRSIEIYNQIPNLPNKQNPSFMDTYAHLLYKIGNYEEAIKWQNEAIDLKKEFKQLDNIDNFKSDLKKMKNKTL